MTTDLPVKPAANPFRHRLGAMPRVLACAVLALAVAACASSPSSEKAASAETTSEIAEIARLRQIAQSALPGSGVVHVHRVGDVVVITGFVETAIGSNAVERALRNAEGVSQVDNQLRWGM